MKTINTNTNNVTLEAIIHDITVHTDEIGYECIDMKKTIKVGYPDVEADAPITPHIISEGSEERDDYVYQTKEIVYGFIPKFYGLSENAKSTADKLNSLNLCCPYTGFGEASHETYKAFRKELKEMGRDLTLEDAIELLKRYSEDEETWSKQKG